LNWKYEDAESTSEYPRKGEASEGDVSVGLEAAPLAKVNLKARGKV
jgi:hypothetical protein